jgi:superfamily I DNA and/or RNA helicase
MNKEQQELSDLAYENYSKALIESITFSEREKHFKSNGLEFNSGYPNYIHYTQEEFIDKCKTDTEFSERWGLKIEERELSLDEELEYMMGKVFSEEALTHQVKIPTRLITITYNNKTITSYE